MKQFEDYKVGEWVVLNKPGHDWHLMQFQAYPSQFTFGAFRLKFGAREIIVDISEIQPISEVNRLMKEEHENVNTDLQRDPYWEQFCEEEKQRRGKAF